MSKGALGCDEISYNTLSTGCKRFLYESLVVLVDVRYLGSNKQLIIEIANLIKVKILIKEYKVYNINVS